jgi:predicted Fe-S protein YdhL (DUF1289 family)
MAPFLLSLMMTFFPFSSTSSSSLSSLSTTLFLSSSSSSSSSTPENTKILPPPSPCVRICRYNADFFQGQVCIGCFREIWEISNWVHFSNVERSYTLMDSADRWNSALEGSIAKEELLRQAKLWADAAENSSN